MDEKSRLWLGICLILGIPLTTLVIVGFFQGLLGIKDWLIPISGFVSLITLAVGSWLAVNEFLLKVEVEKRLKSTAQIESNIQLLTLFSKMMLIANARYDPILSEKVIEGLFQNKIISADDYKDEKNGYLNARNKIETALITPGYGLATQEAAIAAVYKLGRENEILRESAIEGLSSVKAFFCVHFGEEHEKCLAIERHITELKSLR
jgi:hypothetical protein